MLRGRCACRSVSFTVDDAFREAFICHCSNCRALTGSAFMPWGEIERGKVHLLAEPDSLIVLDADSPQHALACRACLSLLLWTVGDGSRVRVPLGTLEDEPSLKPQAHIFVGSKASWYDIFDALPQHWERPPGQERSAG